MTCYLCGKSERRSYCDDFNVHECDKCERPVCQNCAEVDYDCVGDPATFVNCSWICDSLKGGCREDALVPFDPRFHKFDWTTVADAAEFAFINTCRSLDRQTQVTIKSVREATTALRQIREDLAA